MQHINRVSWTMESKNVFIILSGKVSAKSYSSARELFDELDAE